MKFNSCLFEKRSILKNNKSQEKRLFSNPSFHQFNWPFICQTPFSLARSFVYKKRWPTKKRECYCQHGEGRIFHTQEDDWLARSRRKAERAFVWLLSPTSRLCENGPKEKETKWLRENREKKKKTVFRVPAWKFKRDFCVPSLITFSKNSARGGLLPPTSSSPSACPR